MRTPPREEARYMTSQAQVTMLVYLKGPNKILAKPEASPRGLSACHCISRGKRGCHLGSRLDSSAVARPGHTYSGSTRPRKVDQHNALSPLLVAQRPFRCNFKTLRPTIHTHTAYSHSIESYWLNPRPVLHSSTGCATSNTTQFC